MRKLSTILLSFILVLSSLFYVSLNFIEDSGNLFSEYFESDEFMHEMRREMGIDEFIESVPFYQDELKDVFKRIEQSPKTKALVKQYSEMMMVDIIHDSNSFKADVFIESIFNGFEEHINEYENQVMDFLFKLFKTFMVENADQFNLEDHYKHMVDEKRNELTSIELKGIKLLYTLHENSETYKKFSFSVMAISFGLLAVLSLPALLMSLNVVLALTVIMGLYLTYITRQKGYPIDIRTFLPFSIVLLLLSVGLRLFRNKKTA